MTKDKQIEEMAKDLADHSFFYNGGCLMNYSRTAKLLYEAGYRKAYEVEREISEAFRDEMRSLIATSKELFNECEDDYYEGKKDAFFTAIIHLDELLKKKYTEGEKDDG